jgi:hypothetical protein
VVEDTAYEVGVAELIEQGYLAPLTGRKPRTATIDTTGFADRTRRLPRIRLGRSGGRRRPQPPDFAVFVCFNMVLTLPEAHLHRFRDFAA